MHSPQYECVIFFYKAEETYKPVHYRVSYIRPISIEEMGINQPSHLLHTLLLCMCFWQVCAQVPSLENGSYSTDATDFNLDCPGSCLPGFTMVSRNYTETIPRDDQCPSNSIKYDCDLYQTETVTWQSFECKDCRIETSATDQDGNALPESAYEYDNDCGLICLHPFHKRTGPEEHCVNCSHICHVGKYLKDEGNCTECGDCTSTLGDDENLEFISIGSFNDASSCDQQCKDGFYLSMSIPVKDEVFTCIAYSNQTCPENEIFIQGTKTEDSQCEPCISDCEGMREITTCNPADRIQRVCELCTDDLSYGEVFTGINCTKSCAENHIRDTDNHCVLCEHACPVGFKISSPRQHCDDCTACDNKPANSEYAFECEWTCNDGFEFNATTNTCQEQASIIPTPTASGQIWYSFTCENHQKWTITGCQDCKYDNTPAKSLQNKTWNWKPTRTSCDWGCLPGYYSYSFSSTSSSCMNWTDYLRQVATVDDVVYSTDAAQFTVKVNRKTSVVKEWQMVSILVTVVFTSVYMFT